MLTEGNAHDSPEGRKLLSLMDSPKIPVSLLMDRAYEGDETRDLAIKLGYNPVVPPKRNRTNPWQYDKVLYRRRNEVERLFRRIKAYRRVFTRYDKLDIMFVGFVLFSLIFEALKLV